MNIKFIREGFKKPSHRKFPLRWYTPPPPSQKAACQKVNGQKLAEKGGTPPSQKFSVTRVFDPSLSVHLFPIFNQNDQVHGGA